MTLCVVSERVVIVAVAYFYMNQSGNFWIHPRIIFYNKEINCYVMDWIQLPQIRDQ
jgi:hypothetical protein